MLSEVYQKGCQVCHSPFNRDGHRSGKLNVTRLCTVPAASLCALLTHVLSHKEVACPFAPDSGGWADHDWVKVWVPDYHLPPSQAIREGKQRLLYDTRTVVLGLLLSFQLPTYVQIAFSPPDLVCLRQWLLGSDPVWALVHWPLQCGESLIYQQANMSPWWLYLMTIVLIITSCHCQMSYFST